MRNAKKIISTWYRKAPERWKKRFHDPVPTEQKSFLTKKSSLTSIYLVDSVFHNVYIDPASCQHWKRARKFRDGSIFVLELVSAGDKKSSSGSGYFRGKFDGIAATVKSKKRSPNAPSNWKLGLLWLWRQAGTHRRRPTMPVRHAIRPMPQMICLHSALSRIAHSQV